MSNKLDERNFSVIQCNGPSGNDLENKPLPQVCYHIGMHQQQKEFLVKGMINIVQLWTNLFCNKLQISK